MVLTIENLSIVHGSSFGLGVDDWGASQGQLHALLGRNGAGKSTLLKCIAGELTYRGSICLHDLDLSRWDSTVRARHLAVLPQASQLNFSFSAAEVVALGATPLAMGWRDVQAEVRRVMSLAQCEHLRDAAYPGLSGGEKQRVHFARCLLQLSQADKPPLLLLDEPTSAQDLGQQHSLLQQVRRLAEEEGYSVVAVLHDLNQALRYAHRATLLDAGKVVREDTPQLLLTPERVQVFWGYPAERVVNQRGEAVLV